jgi:site-specific DNA recombinase
VTASTILCVTSSPLKPIEFQQRHLRDAGNREPDDHAERRAKLAQEEDSLALKKKNLKDSVATFGPRPTLLEALDEIESLERQLAARRRELGRPKKDRPELPGNPKVLRELLLEEFGRLAVASHEFGQLMRQLVPELHVYLVRLCDGGHLLPRARVRLNLGATFPDVKDAPALGGLLSVVVTLDLFTPPQRELIRASAVSLASEGLTYDQIAGRLPGKVTATAVGNALALHRRMDELGLSNPYVLVTEPPPDYTKLRRHLNANYCFEPVSGYQRPAV